MYNEGVVLWIPAVGGRGKRGQVKEAGFDRRCCSEGKESRDILWRRYRRDDCLAIFERYEKTRNDCTKIRRVEPRKNVVERFSEHPKVFHNCITGLVTEHLGYRT